jgi:tRNA G26 N,N-dimethylase Trm1
MWTGPLQDTKFVSKFVDHLTEDRNEYGTFKRMKGMITLASEVLFQCLVMSTPQT